MPPGVARGLRYETVLVGSPAPARHSTRVVAFYRYEGLGLVPAETPHTIAIMGALARLPRTAAPAAIRRVHAAIGPLHSPSHWLSTEGQGRRGEGGADGAAAISEAKVAALAQLLARSVRAA